MLRYSTTHMIIFASTKSVGVWFLLVRQSLLSSNNPFLPSVLRYLTSARKDGDRYMHMRESQRGDWRNEQATTCAHCLNLVFTVCGFSPAPPK